MIRRWEALPALLSDDYLGECPIWLADEGRLSRVDIGAGRIHLWDPASGESTTIELGAPLGFAIPRVGGGFIVGQRDLISLVERDGTSTPLARISEADPENRFNEARCDPLGRLWAGTMSTVRREGAAALYRVDREGETIKVFDRTTVSNGLGWSPDGERMYFIDSPTQRIDVCDFDLDTGMPVDRRPLVEIPAATGLPDGLVVDSEGGLWVSLFRGHAVHRYDDRGELTGVVEVPVTNPTCAAFGGGDLATLYITSARHRLTPEQIAAEPAGSLFAARTGHHGTEPFRFAG